MEEEIDLVDMLKYFFAKKILIVLVGAICIVGAVLYTKFLLIPEYKATSKIILTNNNFETEGEVYSYAKLPDRYFAVANSWTVFDKVIQNLKLDIEDVLEFKEEKVEIVNSPLNFMITVSVNYNDAKKAAQISNEIVKVTLEEIKKIYNDENVYVLDYAVENWNPINVSYIGNIVKFVLVGEVLVFGYILVCYIFIKDKNIDIKNAEKNN